MGRHSRKGPAPRASDTGSATADATAAAGPGPGTGRRRRPAAGTDQHASASGYGTPAHGVPQVRGGHPEQHEAGGGWGVQRTTQRYGDWQGAPHGNAATTTDPRPPVAQPSRQGPPIGAGARIPGPRREFVEAFDKTTGERGRREGEDTESAPSGEASGRTGKGRTITGIAAAAVTTVLAVVVAGQVTGTDTDAPAEQAAGEADRGTDGGTASRSDQRGVPPRPAPAAPLTYAQLMTRQFPLNPKLKGPGTFDAVAGFDKAPGKGRKVRYRVDVEQGLGLDGKLFAQAVQQTLNDERSWAHGGAMTFERISSGEPEFVITLASPATTHIWCAKSELDTSVDNVSCNSADTERVMINAYRWAQGAASYGAKQMLPYRQMLINHEVGHRLGHGHVNCRTAGALAPVMQQQTKSLNIDGIKCRINPWAHPGD
ncbi:DUF3152 domain-containing protein [Streptomyces sp. NPDC059176]|uniref:DUF3152 domain-containing protein n=1 Tax=unclassified Streptomyces TaxID=2593676 RepID=UPI0036C593EE